MPAYFSRSLRTLESQSSRRNTVLFILLLAFAGIWAGWFVLGRVTVFASTTSARVEVDHENHPVEAEVGGRVAVVTMSVGKVVRAGDVLVELDDVTEQLAQSQEKAKLAPAASQIALLRQELAAQERAIEGERRAGQAALAQVEAETQKSRSAASFAAEEAKRIDELQRRNLISELEALRTRNQAVVRQNEAEAGEFAMRRQARELESREQDRLGQIARLQREIATLEGTQAEARAASNKIGHDIDVRVIRAPIGGRIAELTPLTPGTVVAQGVRICTIVPDGDLRVVALFTPAAALGRIVPGQAARLRVEGFPWTQYGTPTGRVRTVAGEAHDGMIRVELELDRLQAFGATLQHGLPAQVDIEVERTSPASLVMRSVGLYTRLAAATP